jgi:hypothetical protein
MKREGKKEEKEAEKKKEREREREKERKREREREREREKERKRGRESLGCLGTQIRLDMATVMFFPRVFLSGAPRASSVIALVK